MNPFFACQQRAAGCNVRPLAILEQKAKKAESRKQKAKSYYSD